MRMPAHWKINFAMKKIAGKQKTWLSLVGFALLTLCVGPRESFAGKLDPSNWIIYNFSGSLATNLTNGTPLPPTGLHVVTTGGTNGTGQTNGQVAANQLTDLTDNNPATFTTLTNPAIILIDMQATNVVDRIYTIGSVTPSNVWLNYSANSSTPPLGLIVAYVGNTITSTNQVAAWTVPYDAGNPVEAEADMRFSPAAGRFVRLELHTKVTWGTNYWPGSVLGSQPASTNVSWNVGELEFYGFSGPAASETNLNAVVLPSGAAAPLALAAGELSYYLGELTGLPHPIVPPANTNQYSGTLYQIVDLKSLAPNYNTMMANIGNGQLPTNVNATISGRVVTFKSWPYRCVLWSVWQFLESQGIRWVYPDAHGDYVPTSGLNLSVVPFQYTPPTLSIYANFDVNQFDPWNWWLLQSVRQEYLYWFRNHWTYWQGGYGPLGGSEIPNQPATGITINSNYTEGFLGYPDNFFNVLPLRILDMPAYTNLWPWTNTSASSATDPSKDKYYGVPTFIMVLSNAIAFTASKMTNFNTAQPLPTIYPLNICHIKRPWQLLPMDASTFSQDPYTLASNGPAIPDTVPWVKLYTNSYSGQYYSYVVSVANLVQQLSPSTVPLVGAMAYADVFMAPTNIAALATFPTNVQVEVCLYGAPNLLMTAPANAGMKAALDAWRGTCSHLATYDYALEHTDYWEPDPRLPVPLVAGTLSRSQYLASIGALDGGCQAILTSLPYNPWNFYAYPRTRWNTNQTAAQIEQEFFTGYFREAAAPMLAYYQALENYQVTNNVSMYYAGYSYGITPESFPVSILVQMETNLVAAEQLATNWWVVSRLGDIADGFNWVVTNSGLSAANLTNISAYTVFDNTQTNLNLANFQSWTTSYDRAQEGGGQYMPEGNYYFPTNAGGGLAFFSAGYMKSTLNFTQGGTYGVTVNAKGVSAQGISPILSFYLGPNEATWTVSSTSYSNYTSTMTIPPGVWDVLLSFQNQATGGARDVFVDGIQLVRQ
jgi:hypothetical protein